MAGPGNAQPARGRWQARFFAIWGGQQVSLIGSMLGGFALVWWMTESTGSATVLATASLVQMLPQIVLGPLVGALVDRWDRRRVMVVADTAIAAVSALLAYLFWADALQVWHVYAIMAVRAIGGTFHWPAMSASTSLMVPEEHLSRVAGLNQTVHGVLNIASPPLGALLISLLPLHLVMAIDVATAAFAVAPLLVVRIPQPERIARQGTSKPTLWADMGEGFRYVWGWPGLRALLIMAAMINLLLTPANALLPLLVTKHFGGAAPELGWLESLWGVGVVLGGLVLGVWGGFRRRIVTSMLGVMGIGLGALVLGMAPASAFWLALGGMFLLGCMNPLANGPLHAIFQSVVAPDMQGRAFTLIGCACSAMSPIGILIAGPIADAVNVQLWFAIGGVGCLTMAAMGLLSPALMHIEENHRARAGSPSAEVTPTARADAGAG
ncbi:MAG: MFS transporter [Anaerolineae bacterium]|nr:MFS transporter [Anaerolineae bacterium]